MDQAAARTSKEVLDTLVTLLRAFPDDRRDIAARERVQLALTAQTMASQAQAVAAMLLAEADQGDATLRAAGTPSATLLSALGNLPRNQAAAIVYRARDLADCPQATKAAVEGRISLAHAQAVSKAIQQMPATFTPAQTRQAEARLVELAGHRTPDDVVRATSRVAAEIDPVDADEREAARLTREREQAHRDRALMWWTEKGSLQFKGSLPLLEGAAFTTLIDAHANQAHHHDHDAGVPAADLPTLRQRRADALTSITRIAAARTMTTGRTLAGGTPTPVLPPTLAGERPTVMVTLNLDKLKTGAADAATLPDGLPLCEGDWRRTACDANIIPAALGSDSEPLDVGRASRLVTPPIRKALHLRDGHCAFPNCHHPANLSDAHHIRPWWDDGTTSLDNLVLLCPSHHAMVEPDRYAARDQWTVTIGDDKRPHFTEPTRYRQLVANTGPPGPPG